MRRAVTSAAIVLGMILTMSACAGSDDEAAESKVSVSTTPLPSPTPWSATTKPERPQDEFTAAGAEEFAAFVADTVLYMMATGDVPAITSIADMNTCERCRGWAENYDAGKIEKLTISSGPAEHRLVDEPLVNDEVYYNVKLELDIPVGESVRKSTGEKIDTVNAAEGMPFRTNILWKDDRWQLLTYQLGEQ